MKKEKLKIAEEGTQGAKVLVALLLVMAALFFGGRTARCTPFYFQTFNANGAAQTNAVLIQGWPQSTWWVSYGTNLVYTGLTITNYPSAGGFFSNWLYPSTYRVQIPALNTVFYVSIPDTTNYMPLAYYAVNVPATEEQLNSYGVMTNLLGFGPATNSPTGITWALGYTPMPALPALTNLASGGTVFLTNNGVMTVFDAVGQFWRSNTITHNWFFSDTNGATWYDGVMWPTNPTAAFDPTNAAGAASAAVLAQVQTNRFGATNMPGFTGDATNLPGQTNLTLATVAPGGAGGTAVKVTYDQKGRVTGTNALGMGDLPAITAVGSTNGTLWYSVVTNGFGCLLFMQTNGSPGSVGTNVIPFGSICTTTNGQMYVLSNYVWWLK